MLLLSNGETYEMIFAWVLGFEAYNLVFCNHECKYMNELMKTIEDANPAIRSLPAVSYYKDSKKNTPKPITNGWNVWKVVS